MSRPAISSTRLNEHLTLSECPPEAECQTNNWWLYDERVGMNLGMREHTRDEAFVQAIEYWANRASDYEGAYDALKRRVDAAAAALADPEYDDEH